MLISSLGLVFWVGFLSGFDYQPHPYSRQFRIRISSAGSTDGEWTLWFLWFWTWISLQFTHWTARNHGRNLLEIKRKNSEKVPMKILFITSNFSLHVMMTISVPFKNYPKKCRVSRASFSNLYLWGHFPRKLHTSGLRYTKNNHDFQCFWPAKNSWCFSQIHFPFFLTEVRWH